MKGIANQGHAFPADQALCGVATVLLWSFGRMYLEPASVSPESGVLWVTGSFVGLAGVWVGFRGGVRGLGCVAKLMSLLGVAASLVGMACCMLSLAIALSNVLGFGPDLNLKGVSPRDPRLSAYSGMFSVNRSAVSSPELPEICDVSNITPIIDLGEGDEALLLQDGKKRWLIWFVRMPDSRLEWASELFQAKGPLVSTVYSGSFPAEVELKLRGPLGDDGAPVVAKSFSRGVFLPTEIVDLVEPGRQRSPEEIAQIIAAWDGSGAVPRPPSQP
jgi:hypothetical protein